MLTEQQTAEFAQEWIEAWNSHDLDRILSHYAEDVEFFSPFAIRLTGAQDGKIQGKENLRAYFSRALAAYPDLHFLPHEAFVGAMGVTLYYTSVENRKAAETMLLNPGGKISKVHAHYDRV